MSDIQNEKIDLNFFKDTFTDLLFIKFDDNGYYFVVLLVFVPLYLAGIYENGFWSINKGSEMVNKVPLVKDIGIITQIIYLILLGKFIVMFFKNLNVHLTKLWNNDVFNINDITVYKNHLKKYESQANSIYIYILGIIFALILFIYDTYIEDDIVDVIFTSNSPLFPLTKTVLTIGGLIQSFMFGIFLWKLIVLVKLIKSLCKNSSFSLKELNPGATHTLHPIGDIMYDMSRITLLFTYTPLSSIIFALYWQPDVSKMFFYRGITTSVLYVILSLIIFTYPLIPSHIYMKEQKSKLLNDNKKEYKNISYLLFNDSTNLFDVSNKQVIDNYILIKNLNADINNMQEWPLNTTYISEIFKSLISPITLTIFQVIVQYYLL